MQTKYHIVALTIVLGLLVWGVDVGLMALNIPDPSTYMGLIALIGFVILGLRTSKLLARHQHVEKELHRANRALRVLSECNQVMVRATQEDELLHDICRIIVDVGGYHLAWVGFVEENESKTVTPVAQMGYEEGYLDSVNITWADTERGRGPTGTAIRTSQPYAVRNILTDPHFFPWRQEASKRGYASVIGLPLNANGQPFGALTIYAQEADAFDADEVSLLTDLADDLAYGIIALRTQIERQKVEKALRKTQAKKQAILNAIPDMIVQIGIDGSYKVVKSANNAKLWISPNEFVGKKLTEVFPADVAQQTIERVSCAIKTGEIQVFEYQLPVNRIQRDFEARLIICNKSKVTAIVRDITERKTREAIVEEERHRIARDLHDGVAQNLYFVGLKLDYLSKTIKSTCDPEETSSELYALKKTVQANIDDVRRTIFSLRPVELDKLGFAPAVRKYTQEFGEQTRLKVNLEIEGDEGTLPPTLEPIFFRLVQEGLNNIAKHARANHAWVALAINPKQIGHLTIRDDGIGFNPDTLWLNGAGKMGLRQMRERVMMLGGQFDVESIPMQGTTLCAEIPL